MKALVAGWFSFKEMGATSGDLYCKDIVCRWLDNAMVPHDIAFAGPFQGGVQWQDVNPEQYTHVIFLCGPFGNGWPITGFLDHFPEAKLMGINLSMLQALEEWNPFDLLLERDSTRDVYPDISFLSGKPHVPVVGLILVEPQKEYGDRACHRQANEIISAFLTTQHCAVVPIDTRLDIPNKGGLKSPEEIESLIARMDMVITTRLHGMVLAIKNSVPVLAIDAIRGGAKVTRQAEAIHWANVIKVDQLSEQTIMEGFQYCFTVEAKSKTIECRNLALDKLNQHEKKFIDFIKGF